MIWRKLRDKDNWLINFFRGKCHICRRVCIITFMPAPTLAYEQPDMGWCLDCRKNIDPWIYEAIREAYQTLNPIELLELE